MRFKELLPENNVIQGNFGRPDPNNTDVYFMHLYQMDPDRNTFDWAKSKHGNKASMENLIQRTLQQGFDPEHIKIERNGDFIDWPEYGITR